MDVERERLTDRIGNEMKEMELVRQRIEKDCADSLRSQFASSNDRAQALIKVSYSVLWDLCSFVFVVEFTSSVVERWAGDPGHDGLWLWGWPLTFKLKRNWCPTVRWKIDTNPPPPWNSMLTQHQPSPSVKLHDNPTPTLLLRETPC